MSTITPQQQQYYKELVTPFQPMGRLLVGTDLRGTQCDRFGNGELRLVGYGDSSGGYAFSPKNQDAAIAPSFNSASLSNIANSLPRLTEVQDNAGKWIDTITLHALDEFIEQTEPQSFIGNTLRIFSGGQKDFRGDGTGNRNIRNTYTLIAEVPIPALTRADVPRSFPVRGGVYIPPSQNIYLGLAIPQPYTVSFELWDLQANTSIGSGFSSSIGGSSTVGNGNDLSDSLSDTPVDTQFVLPISFASATWVVGAGATGTQSGFGGGSGSPNVPPPTPTPPPSSGASPNIGGGSPSKDKDDSQPPPDSSGTPNTSSGNKSTPQNPPPSAGCTPIQDCQWRKVSVPSNVGKAQVNTGDYTGLCPKGTASRGIIEFETAGTFVLCCGPATFPPNNLGCSSLMKWSCVSGGNCVEDALGTYNSLAECQAALVPANFTGGQCKVRYQLTFTIVNSVFGSGTQSGYTTQLGAISNFRIFKKINGLADVQFDSFSLSSPLDPITENVTISGAQGIWDLGGGNEATITITNIILARNDGLPDNCGNPPPTCP